MIPRRPLVAIAIAAAAWACNGSFRFDPARGAGDGADAGDEGGGPPAVPPAGGGACSGDADCASLALRCDVASGRCVACLADGDCAAPTPRCAPSLHVCVACVGASDCASSQRCDEGTTYTCLDVCHDDDDPCPQAGFVCSAVAMLCMECRSSANCAGNPHGSRCDPDIGRCVDCLGNAQCPTDRPQCDRRTGKCVVCVTSNECPAGSACVPQSSTCAVP